MRARAELAVAHVQDSGGRVRTRISRLRSDGPLLLRPTVDTGPQVMRHWHLTGPRTARVSRVSGAAGPLGGDDLGLHIEVGPRAALVLRDVSATLVLPGPHGDRSVSRTTVHVGPDATLVWLPEPVIAARGCDHEAATIITLETGARLLLREELLLGRHAESPGRIRQRLRVCQDGRVLYDQELAVGPDIPGWRGPAVTGGRRALGSLLLVDPHRNEEHVVLRSDTAAADVAVLSLGTGGLLVSALAADGLTLRLRLDAALAALN